MCEKSYFIHKTSLLGKDTKVGLDTKIWQFCNIMNNVCIGDNCNIGQNVFIESGVKIGNNVKIKNNISIYTGVICEDDVFLGPSCVFTNVINPRSFIERKNEFKNTLVKKGASVGANVTIVCGNTIGRYAMLGAGSVITKDVPDFALMIGVPAKQIGWVCECGEKLDNNFKCKRCAKEYEYIDSYLIEKSR